MNAQDANAESFDVFLCHNSEDKPAVREIAQKLSEEHIKPWLDEEQIRPGTSWQTALGLQIASINSAAVFVGESGFGPWQNQEIQALLSQFVERACPVIPAILPSAKTRPALPWSLKNIHCIDFRETGIDPLEQLIWGITGKKPRDQSHVSSAANPSEPPAAVVKELLPAKEKVVIELRLPGNLDAFSNEEQLQLVAAVKSLFKLGDVLLTRRMSGSIRLRLELKPEDADKIYAATKGQLADLGISEARLYPAIAVPPNGEQRSQLLILLDRVKETWVDGVLKHSLYNEALMSLGKHPIEETVESPWKHVVELSSQRNQLFLQDRNITTIFDATGLLLILGEPGSGKTTTLLDLASNLITRAKADAKERVPVVLNLSSWKKKQPLVKWIAMELSEKYRVPVKIARSWLEYDYLVPLLDGLDEVPTSLQPDCVTAINDFIDESGLFGLVVCCRLNEYRWLPKRLKLNGAIRLEPLSENEVAEYLARGGSKLAALREAVSTDPVLQELAQTPLMLSIMSLAYQEARGNELAAQKGNSEQRRKQIFGLYVEQMFQREGNTALGFPKEKIIGWLSWLAEKMEEHSQSVFLVEGLQPSWLRTRAKRVGYETVVTLSLGLIFGLFYGLIFGLFYGLIFGLIGGLIVGLIVVVGVVLDRFWKSPGRNWKGTYHSWRALLVDEVLSSGSIGARVGGCVGAILGFVVGLATLGVWAVIGLIIGSLIGWPIGGLPIGGIVALIFTVIICLAKFGEAVLGADSLDEITLVEAIGWKWSRIWKMRFPQWVRVDKASPNQGIKLSRNNSLAMFLVSGLITGLIVGLIFGLMNGLMNGLIAGIIVGLTAGLLLGLNGGGSAVIKHYFLRLFLWLKGYTPFRFVKFLNCCARLILLKKVGGGYIFTHRMLLEYFADLTPSKNEKQN